VDKKRETLKILIRLKSPPWFDPELAPGRSSLSCNINGYISYPYNIVKKKVETHSGLLRGSYRGLFPGFEFECAAEVAFSFGPAHLHDAVEFHGPLVYDVAATGFHRIFDARPARTRRRLISQMTGQVGGITTTARPCEWAKDLYYHKPLYPHGQPV
jgi:hypothetical protein